VSQISQISIGNNTGGIQNGATQEGEFEPKKHGKSKALLRKLTSVESLDGHATLLHNLHEGQLFKSSASDSSKIIEDCCRHLMTLNFAAHEVHNRKRTRCYQLI
jgi:hypothetical protein